MIKSPCLCISDLDKFLKESCETIILQPKIDGVRVLAEVYLDGVRYFSRNKKELSNLNGVFDDRLLRMTEYFSCIADIFGLNFTYPIIYDCELCSVSLDLKTVMNNLFRKSGFDSSNLVLNIFDIILPNQILLGRLKILDAIHGILSDKGNVQLVLSYRITKNKDEIFKEFNNFLNKGYEGIVLKDGLSLYSFKRSKYWCKLVPEKTVDLKVICAEKGTGKYANKLGYLLCEDDNGNKIRVGSGFTDEEREEFLKNCPKCIEVSYREKTEAGMLRFPVFKRIRPDKE